ncbi:MAG: DUF2283 domain-containing protein [Candidatus Micrarchaeota archaeon]
MKYEYDPEVDIATIKIHNGKPDYGEEIGNIIAHYDKTGKLVELEILNASKNMFKVAKSIVAHATKS